MARCIRQSRTAGTESNWPAPAAESSLRRRPGFDPVIPGLQVGLFRLDADIHHPGKGDGGEGIDVGGRKAVAADVLVAFQVLIQEVHEFLNTLPAFLAP